MSRKDDIEYLTQEIINQTGQCWPCIKQIADYLHQDDDAVKKLLKGHYGRRRGRAFTFNAHKVAEIVYDSQEIF